MPDDPRKLSRRDFVGAALAPLVLNLAGCGEDAGHGPTGDDAGPSSPGVIESGAVLLGLYGTDGAGALREAAGRLDFSWLSRGDTVLIKVAVNSPYAHPMTTSVSGVEGMVAELRARGAGRVIVADQCGVEHVRLSAVGRAGATREAFAANGMASVEQAGAELHYFDDGGFDAGYFLATLDAPNRWPRGLYLPNVVREVDHIVYMPRIGTHILAGNTLAQKMAIGWLRDDSRHDLHNDAADFYEKYAEVNYARELRERFRMAVTVSEKILLHGGPDAGTPHEMSPVLVHASTSLPNHDALGASLLATLNARVTTVSAGAQVYDPGSAPLLNRFFSDGASVLLGAAGPWRSGSTQTVYVAHRWEQGVTLDRAIRRGWELTGGMPGSIRIVGDGAPLDAELRAGVTAHGEGLYAFS